MDLSRRAFLGRSSAIASASLLKIGAPGLAALTQAACSAKEEAAAFTVLTAADANDLAAIAARILPTTDTPGATEAGVIYFFDRALGAEQESMLPFILGGLEELNADRARFAALSEAEQDRALSAIEDGEFFNGVWFLTMVGFFAMSRYGGNKDKTGWDLIGFAGDHGAWTYPFGHYDAEHSKAMSDGE